MSALNPLRPLFQAGAAFEAALETNSQVLSKLASARRIESRGFRIQFCEGGRAHSGTSAAARLPERKTFVFAKAFTNCSVRNAERCSTAIWV